MVIAKLKRIINVAAGFAAVLTLSLITLNVYAGEGGGESGGGVACYKNGQFLGSLCTKYGAEWRWYATNSDNVVIYGKAGGYSYAHDTTITGCAKYGGYWRYGMISYGTNKLSNGQSYGPGDQVGVTAIGMQKQYSSEHFGGGMVDRNPGNWNKAETIYRKLQQLYPSEFYRGWDANSSLEWFCGGQDENSLPDEGEDPTPDPGPDPVPPDECGRWTPSSFTNSNATYGVTSIEVKVKSMEQRVASTAAGDWTDGDIYVKPTDEVAWYTCYYGGTPATAHTQVSYASGNSWQGWDELDTEDCGNNNGIWGYQNQDPNYLYGLGYQELWTLASTWENKFSIGGAGEAIRGGYSTEGGEYQYDLKTTDHRQNGHVTQQGDAGRSFSEWGRTGSPYYVSVGNYYGGSYSIYKSECPPEIDYDRPEIVEGYITKYGDWYWDDYEGRYKQDTWEEWGEISRSYPYYKPPRYDCYTCTNKYSKYLPKAYISYYTDYDSAYVRVPYNYVNYSGVNINSEFVYSGETVDVDAVWTNTVVRYNDVTLDTYATQVPSARIKLFAYVTDDPSGGDIADTVTDNEDGCSLVGRGIAKQCVQLDSTWKTLNADGNLGGAYDEIPSMSGEYNVLDAAAGDYMCFTTQVYPATSGDATKYWSGGDGMWRYSLPTCIIIAKKPTFQVWGSGLYSVEGINAALGAKVNLYNDYINNMSNYRKKGHSTNSTTFFGSWSEHSLILKNGLTTTVASGAATGLNDIPSGAGNKGSPFCNSSSWSTSADRSPLSFSNNCSGGDGAVGNSGIDSGATNREELLDYWLGESGGSGTVDSTVNLSNPDSIGNVIKTPTDVQVHYAESSGDVRMTGTVPAGQTYFIKVNGDVIFDQNVRYASGPYTALNTIPKLVIYANNFKINCKVTNVDAILIGGEGSNLDTCYNSGDDDVNNPIRSQGQFKLFGVAMIDSVDLKRTYGAATWNQSAFSTKSDVEAAELFDYDSTILMWSEFLGGTAETDVLQTSYQHEIAPRY